MDCTMCARSAVIVYLLHTVDALIDVKGKATITSYRQLFDQKT